MRTDAWAATRVRCALAACAERRACACVQSAIFTTWLLYVEILLVSVCGMIWIFKLTECLALYQPLLILPLMVGTYILFGGVAGGIFFREVTDARGPAPMRACARAACAACLRE